MSKHISQTEKHRKCCICGEEFDADFKKQHICYDCLSHKFEKEHSKSKIIIFIKKMGVYLLTSLIIFCISRYLLSGMGQNMLIFRLLYWFMISFVIFKSFYRKNDNKEDTRENQDEHHYSPNEFVCRKRINAEHQSHDMCNICFRRHKLIFKFTRFTTIYAREIIYGIWAGITVDVIIGIIEKFM